VCVLCQQICRYIRCENRSEWERPFRRLSFCIWSEPSNRIDTSLVRNDASLPPASTSPRLRSALPIYRPRKLSSFILRLTVRAAASTRVLTAKVLEYYSSSKILECVFTTRVRVTFYFGLQISILGCSFSFSHLMNCGICGNMGLWNFIWNLPACMEIDPNICT